MKAKTHSCIFKIVLAIFAVSIVSVGTALAQFKVPDARPVPAQMTTAADTVRRLTKLENKFFSRAKWDAEQRKIRKERNTVEFTGKLELSQTQFENWSSGGENTFSGRATIFYRHQYQRKKLGIDYKVEARYGMNHIDKKTFKNEDEFKLNFTTTWTIHKNWSWAGTTNLRSQFTQGCRSRTDKTRVSAFMAPGFFDVAVGFTYKNAPFNIVISPVGGSAVTVLDDKLAKLGLNGVPKGVNSKWQVGPSVKINFDKTFAKNIVRVRSEAYSFTNIKTAPSVRWETSIDIRATKFLTTTLYGNMNYNKDAKTVRPDHLQYKYSLSVGLAYTFKNK